MELSELRGIYERYDAELAEAVKKAGLFSGVLGFGTGRDPRADSCNGEFYESVERWVDGFLEGSPGPEEALEAAEVILWAAAASSGKTSYWYKLAAQGHAMKLLPCLTGPMLADLERRYRDAYPKNEWLPVQEKLVKALSKGAKRR